MSLPVANLDDRRHQDIVDEAKRLVPHYCREWTDLNVSDPGVALIELFAWMTEIILYRVNQIPDRHYVKFLELMGITLFPPSSARTTIAFELSAPQPEPVRVPAGTQVGTVRTEQDDSVVFVTDGDLLIVVPHLIACVGSTGEGRYADRWEDLQSASQAVTCFDPLAPGSAVYFGFAESLANNILELDFTVVPRAGTGIQPERPPWSWEVWSGEEWVAAEVQEDGTGGLNRDGELTLLMPRRHEPLALGPVRAHWVRCRLLAPASGQEGYEASPRVLGLDPVVRGGLSVAHHAQSMPREQLGRSDHTPGQAFRVRRSPVLPRRPGETVEVLHAGGAERWTEVDDFAGSQEEDRHFTWDDTTGDIRFGPLVHYSDGMPRQHGAIPPVDAEIAVTGYRHGGGRRGNVGTGTLTVLKSSIPFIRSVYNLTPAEGGVDGETIANAKERGPMTLRTGQRAVTVQDFERLALGASRGVARARCLPPATPGGPVQVLLVPDVDKPPEKLTLDDLRLKPELYEEVAAELEQRRILATTVEIRHPRYYGIKVEASVQSTPGSNPELVEDRLRTALYRYVNPLVGGPERTGWPFGRPLNLGEIYALLAGVEGVQNVDEVSIKRVDLRDPGTSQDVRQRVGIPEDGVFASFEHEVEVR